VLVCYSGGVDSALMLAAAHAELGTNAVGMTAVSPSLADFERQDAVAKEIGARHELVESDELDDENYQRNLGDRCFFCKSELYRVSQRMQTQWGLRATVNGTNTNDLGDYRPGLEAASQAGVQSPFVELGWNKSEVRRVASLIGLAVWDKPASACLASRVPYGTRVTRERLIQIGQLEARLHAMGLRQVRVRLHPLAATAASIEAQLARVEVADTELARAFELRTQIANAGRESGFAYITLDLEGYRMGSHNALLSGRSLKVLGQH
jgi:pyridinium-3,5-biscarboxylic acid mononucleotide sulfurtransferase